MQIKFLFLFSFLMLFFNSGVVGQVLVDQLTLGYQKERSFNGNVEKAIQRIPQVVGLNLKFNLSLIDVDYQNAINSTTYYDRAKNIIKEEQNTVLNNDFIFVNCTGVWEYDGNTLISHTSVCSDTTIIKQELHYNYDDKGRIIYVGIKHPISLDRSEEIVYTDKGRTSTLFTVILDKKEKAEELVYDLNNRLVSITTYQNLIPNNPVLKKYFYRDDGRVVHQVERYSLYNPISSSDKYSSYYYKKSGVLRKTKTYELEGEEVGLDLKYKKGKHNCTVKYKEKLKKKYILQTVKKKTINKSSKIISKSIYDQKRNKVMEYIPESGILQTWEFSYY